MTNVLVHAQNFNPSSLSQFTNPPPAVGQALDRIQTSQLARLPSAAQRAAAGRVGAVQDDIRQRALNANPIANGQLPTTPALPSSLPNTSALRDTVGSQVPGSSLPPSGNVSGQAATSPSSGSSSTSSSPAQRGTIDPLGASVGYISAQDELARQSDIATLTSNNAREIRFFTQYYEGTYAKVEQLSAAYMQLKNIFSLYEDELDAMLAKLPATVSSCVKVP